MKREQQLLALLSRHGELPMSQIATLLGVAPSAASRLANGMVDLGLLSRRNSRGDLRVVLFALTEDGQEVACTTVVRAA
jgi:DNA-binding MarR family transcriptional regulator